MRTLKPRIVTVKIEMPHDVLFLREVITSFSNDMLFKYYGKLYPNSEFIVIGSRANFPECEIYAKLPK